MDLFFGIMAFVACFQRSVCGAPLELLSIVPARNYDVPPPPPHGNHVHVGKPRLVPEPDSTTFICLVQEIDGNFRVLRSLSESSCDNNEGQVLYESSIHLPLADPYEYFTRMQWNGNLFTRKYDTTSERGEKGNIGVWKTISPEAFDHKAFALVLNEDDTLSIVLENTTTIWNSATGEVCYTTGARGETCDTTVDPAPTTVAPELTTTTAPETTSTKTKTTTASVQSLVLMTRGARVWNGTPIAIHDPSTDSFVCVFQEASANFVISRGANCASIDRTSIIYQTCLALSDTDSYYTRLQCDGNLVTRREDPKETVWTSRSGQGTCENADFVLVLTASDTLEILNGNGDPIWDSEQDDSCTPTFLRKRS